VINICLYDDDTHTYTHASLTASFPGQPGKPAPEKLNQPGF